MKHLPEKSVRSKGQATLFIQGAVGLTATIHDISVASIGVMVPRAVEPGTRLCVDTHGHGADGTVVHCHPKGNEFYIGIALDRPAA